MHCYWRLSNYDHYNNHDYDDNNHYDYHNNDYDINRSWLWNK